VRVHAPVFGTLERATVQIKRLLTRWVAWPLNGPLPCMAPSILEWLYLAWLSKLFEWIL